MILAISDEPRNTSSTRERFDWPEHDERGALLARELEDRLGLGVAAQLLDVAAELPREVEQLVDLAVMPAQRLARRVHVHDPELALKALGQTVAAAHELLGDLARPCTQTTIRSSVAQGRSISCSSM